MIEKNNDYKKLIDNEALEWMDNIISTYDEIVQEQETEEEEEDDE